MTRKFLSVPLFYISFLSQGLRLEELSPPILWWQHGNALCSQVRAVDSRGVLWHNEGCEDGRFRFEEVGRLPAARVEALRAAFDSFPLPPPEVSCGGGMAHRFLQRDAGGNEIYWTSCGSSNVQGEVVGLEAPFLDAARVLAGP